MSKVSAIITTFNRKLFLEKAIESVLSQTFEDFELIILDNSSTDGTDDLVANFQDKRIRYIKHQPMSISDTRNYGVKCATSEFIAFLDDDDEWLPNKLELQVKLFAKSSEHVALIYGGFYRVSAKGDRMNQHSPTLKGKVLERLLDLRNDFTGSASNPMIRKSCIYSVSGFDPLVKTGEDWEFYLRLCDTFEVDFVDEPIVNIRHHHGTRLGDRLRDYIDLEVGVMKKFKTIFDKNKKLKSFYLQRLGGKWLRLGDKKQGYELLRDSIVLNPCNGYAYLQILTAVFGRSFYLRCHNLYLYLKRSYI